MLEKIKQHLLPLAIIFILSLIPFLWLKNGAVILGHDAGTPLSPAEHFTDRLQLWTYRYGGGSDQTFAIAGFFLHGFEYVLDQTNLSVSNQQKIEFSVYFLLMGLSMYAASQVIFKKLQPEFALIAAVIYEFNHFILQGWFIAERTKFSVYIALPILTALIFMVFRKEIKPIYAGLISGLVLTVLNGGGFLPLYASVFLTVGTTSLAILIFTKPFKEKLIEFLIYAGSFVSTYLLCNMFWMLPYYWYLKATFSQLVGEAGGLSGILNWVMAISENTSFLNLLRLQGIQEWYVNPEHPYAASYFTNPFLILLSFVPLLVISATFLRYTKKKNIVVTILLLILLFSLFLMAGSHKPFGFLYVLLLKYVPGFVAFRTPYYKFAPAFFFAFALLASYLTNEVLNTHKRRTLAIGGIIVLYLIYNFPFFTVNFFQYTHERTTKIMVPEYAYQYAEYIRENPDHLVRTALFPGLNLNDYTSQYAWGYWSLAPLHSLLDRHQYLLPQPATNDESELVAEFYKALIQNKPEWPTMAQMLGIDSILIENDFNQFNHLGISSESVEKMISTQESLVLLREFDKWKLYKLNTAHEVHPNYIQFTIPFTKVGDVNYINNFIFNKMQVTAPIAYSRNTIPSLNRVGILLKAACQDCQIRREQSFIANPNIVFTPGSKLSFLGGLFGINYEHDDIQSNSLQKLYILQTLVQRKEPSELHIPIWHQYLTDLEVYEALITTETHAEKLNHSNLLNSFSNIQFQKSGLQDMSVFVNTSGEAELFTQVLSRLQKLEQMILETNTITINSNKYKLAITPPEPGEYSIYVYNELLNASLAQEVIDVTMHGASLSASLVTTDEWSQLGTQQLENKEYIIDLADSDFKSGVVVPESVTVGNNKPCQELTTQVLPKGLYSFDIGLISPETNANVTVHVHKKSEKKPLLPYWGSPIELPQNLNKTSLIVFDVEDEQETTILLCAFTLKTFTEIKISSFDLNRQTNPVVFLYRTDNAALPASGNYTIERNSNTHNSYHVTTSAPGFINTLHPYGLNWQSAGADNLSNIRINDGMQGIVVPAGVYTLEEEYATQKYYLLGSKISLLSGLGILIFLGYRVYTVRKIQP